MREFGKIGNVSLSRLILGGNMIGGWAHCRDMRFYDKLVKASQNGLGVCDNRFVDTDRREVFDYMQSRPEPWIAFKILGAGIEHPREAFPIVYKGGADFACVGMYDYQLVEDVNIANEVFKDGLPSRHRPWHG